MTFRKFSGEEGESWWEGGHVTPEYFLQASRVTPVPGPVTDQGDPDPGQPDSTRARTGQIIFCFILTPRDSRVLTGRLRVRPDRTGGGWRGSRDHL